MSFTEYVNSLNAGVVDLQLTIESKSPLIISVWHRSTPNDRKYYSVVDDSLNPVPSKPVPSK
jgi:hypothetical protein